MEPLSLIPVEEDVPFIDRYCNNDALGLIFEFVGGFDLLATIPFVCKRWRKVAKGSPLRFDSMKGWAFALPDSVLAAGPINVSILASTKNRDFIPYRDLHENSTGMYKIINNVYWYYTNLSLSDGSMSNYIFGTMKFSNDTPHFYFALEQTVTGIRDLVIHSDIFELLTHGISVNFKNCMKEQYFDKLQKKRIEAYKNRIRKRYRPRYRKTYR